MDFMRLALQSREADADLYRRRYEQTGSDHDREQMEAHAAEADRLRQTIANLESESQED